MGSLRLRPDIIRASGDRKRPLNEERCLIGNTLGSRFWRGERTILPLFRRLHQEAQLRRFVVKELARQDHAPEPADQRHGEERLLAYSPLAVCCPSLVDAHREEADNARQKEPD